MTHKAIAFNEWMALSSEAKKEIYDSWNRYRGDGKEIIQEACRLLREKFRKYDDVTNVTYGVYHGGDWVISVSLRVGHRVKVPDTFYGFMVVRLYKDLSDVLRHKLVHEYRGNVGRFVDAEIKEFARCFNFTDSPHAKQWLGEFVKGKIGK